MIDIEQAIRAFNIYSNDFDVNNKGISLKIKHTFFVMKHTEDIMTSLGRSEEDKNIAKLIALLHDIGRFEQIKQIGVFDDSQFDHALMGVDLLFAQGKIKMFIKTREYDELIKAVILNHSLYKVDERLTLQARFFSNVLRDSDKLDIFRTKLEGPLSLMYDNPESIAKERVSIDVYEALMACQTIDSHVCKTTLDRWLMSIGFVFDIYFSLSFEYIKEHEYIDLILNVFSFEDDDTLLKIERIRFVAKDFIARKLTEVENG